MELIGVRVIDIVDIVHNVDVGVISDHTHGAGLVAFGSPF